MIDAISLYVNGQSQLLRQKALRAEARGCEEGGPETLWEKKDWGEGNHIAGLDTGPWSLH